MQLIVNNDEMLGITTDKILHLALIEKDKEIERLNNVINELEKWLEDYKIQLKKYNCIATISIINFVLDKLKELKEGKGDK